MIPEQSCLGRSANEVFYGTLRGYSVARWRGSQKTPMTFKVWQEVERLAFMFVLMVLVCVFHPSTTSISRVCGALKGIPGRFIERLHVLNRCWALYRCRNVGGSISDLVLFLWILLPLKVHRIEKHMDWYLVNMKPKLTPITFLKHVSGVSCCVMNRCMLFQSRKTVNLNLSSITFFPMQPTGQITYRL